MKILVTGAAGFIGAHVSAALCAQGYQVVGIDNLNNYYDTKLKHARLDDILSNESFKFQCADITDSALINELFNNEKFERVIHLAGQAGIRYSIEEPMAYGESNLMGHLTILEACRHHNVGHLVYASSSSIYGLNTKVPFSTSDSVDTPVSLYAATKKANELMAHSYSQLYGLPTTGLRFFTVYGPWGRPDMALFKFTKAIIAGEPIDVYNHGELSRDFTYIDDIVEAVIRVQDRVPDSYNVDTQAKVAPYKLYNIGNGAPVKLVDFINCIEDAIGVKAQKNLLPMQAGDVEKTWADCDDLYQDIDFKPNTDLKDGVEAFVAWYRDYYHV